MNFNKENYFQIASGFFLLSILIIVLHSSATGEYKLDTIGAFMGGVLGPIFTLLTLMYLIKSNEENFELNFTEKFLKYFEIYKNYLKSEENKLNLVPDFGEHNRVVGLTGFEVIKYVIEKPTTHFNVEYENIFIWVEKYIDSLVFLMNKAEKYPELVFTVRSHFDDQIKLFKQFHNVFSNQTNVVGLPLKVNLNRIIKKIEDLEK